MVLAAGHLAAGVGSAARGRGIALIRLDRVAEAEPASLTAGEIPIRLIKPDWARFSFPGEIKATE